MPNKDIFYSVSQTHERFPTHDQVTGVSTDRSLAEGTDLNTVGPGFWRVTSSSVASTIRNLPPDVVAQQGFVLEVRVSLQSLDGAIQKLTIAPNYLDRPISWTRHKDNSGKWGAWRQHESGWRIKDGTNVFLLPPGGYSVPSASSASTMVNRPPAVVAGQAAVVTVYGGTAQNTRVVTWQIVPAASEAARIWQAHRDTSGAWSVWVEITPATGNPQVARDAVVINSGQDLNTLTAGDYIIPTKAVAESLVNSPYRANIYWGGGAAVLRVILSNLGKNALNIWTETPNASLKPREAIRQRDNAGTWGSWVESSATSSLTGEAALPTLAPLSKINHDAMRTAVRLNANSLSANHPGRWTAPAGTKLEIPTPDGTGQAVHPKVIDTGTPAFGGWRYWMAVTPYAFANDALEDPCVLVSNDGVSWVVPSGLQNPLDDQPGSPEYYNSDTDMVLRNGVLYLVWRTSKIGAAPDTIYWRKTIDGVNWSEKQAIYTGGGLGEIYGQVLSPVLLPNGDGWRMYFVAANAHPNRLAYVETTSFNPTPSSWGGVTRCNFSGQDQPIPKRDPWHIDIIKAGSDWWLLLNDCIERTGGLHGDLILCRSDNGVDWVSGSGPLIPRVSEHHDALYRGTLISLPDDTFDIWYSARVSQNQRWTISKTNAYRDC